MVFETRHLAKNVIVLYAGGPGIHFDGRKSAVVCFTFLPLDMSDTAIQSSIANTCLFQVQYWVWRGRHACTLHRDGLARERGIGGLHNANRQSTPVFTAQTPAKQMLVVEI
jgi:hypothetical protein